MSRDKVSRVYFADNIGVGHAEIIERFNELYKGRIEVVPIDLPFEKFNTNQRKELIARNLRSRGSRIDVFSVDLIWVHRFTKWAEPLAPHFSPTFLSEMLPQALSTCYVRGTLYAIPLYTDIGALYYRKDMIRQLPDGEAIEDRIQSSITWEEIEDLRARYFPDQPVYVPQADDYEGLICNFNEWLGRPLQDGNGKLLALTDSHTVARVTYFRDMFRTGMVPIQALDMTEDPSIRFALAHDIPFVRGWPTTNNEGDPRFDQVLFNKLAIAPLPHFRGEQPAPVFGGWNMMLSKHSPVKEEAILFMEFASSAEGQSIFYDAEGLLPIHQAFYDGEADNPRKQRLMTLEEMMSSGVHRPALDKYTLISDILSKRLHQILKGTLEVEEGLALADDEIKQALERSASF